MSDHIEIVRCCICNKSKDLDDTDQCTECGKYVCFECGIVEKHSCDKRKPGVNSMSNKGKGALDIVLGVLLIAGLSLASVSLYKAFKENRRMECLDRARLVLTFCGGFLGHDHKFAEECMDTVEADIKNCNKWR